ncbi:MAG TPA: IS110 family transposase [Caldilineae bacterium]|nr:IS110 family transposase [Caldilineae bacterium]
MATTPGKQCDEESVVMYMALELSNSSWVVLFGNGDRTRRRKVGAGDVEALMTEVAQAKARLGLDAQTPVLSCFEAGRDGFWLHRYLQAQGIDNRVVDSSSIAVDRRARRAKTDRIDVEALLSMLRRQHGGERKVWSVVRVPSEDAEAQRHWHRERTRLLKEGTALRNSISSLLITQGARLAVKGKDFMAQVAAYRRWDGTPLPAALIERVAREWARLELITTQRRQMDAERRERLAQGDDASLRQVTQLMRLRGVGIESAWVLVMELFGWREFPNRRQLAGAAGLTPTPFQSGNMARDQGISKAGNRRVRALLIELAWMWVRHQPDNVHTRWFQRRFGHGSARQRRIGIVALARRLLIELWRYLRTGTVSDGTLLMAA